MLTPLITGDNSRLPFAQSMFPGAKMISFGRIVLVALSLTFLAMGARRAVADAASEQYIHECISGSSAACSKAVDALTVAIKIKPDDGDLLSDRATMYRKMGLTEKAIDDYKKATSGKSTAIGFTTIYRNLSDIYSEKSDYDFAIAYQLKAIEWAPDFIHISADLYESLARLYLKKGDSERAQAAFSKSIELAAQKK